MRKIYTREELSECFRINKKGELERLYQGNRWGRNWRVVECKANHNNPYCRVWFKDSRVMYHSVIWILTYGTIEDTEAVIDHKNGDKLDNRIENLRLVSNRENTQNSHKHRNGRLTGCYFRKDCNKWTTQISISGKSIRLGYYNSELEAHQIYLKAYNLIDQYIDSKQFKILLKQP